LNSYKPPYWSREDFPNPLRERLCRAHAEFQRDLIQIGRQRTSVIVTQTLRPGEVRTSRNLDHAAQLSVFGRRFEEFLEKLSEAWARDVIDRSGLRSDEAIEAFLQQAHEFVEEARPVWNSTFSGAGSEECFNRLAKHVVERKVAALRSLWPHRGRPSSKSPKLGTDELAIAITKLLNGDWKGKKTQLAAELRVDLKTLQKVLRGESVTDTTRQKISDHLQRIPATSKNATHSHL
jgi:hypothetical protein